jgi:hypothetical protein
MKNKKKHLITISILVIFVIILLGTHYYPKIFFLIGSIIFFSVFYWFIYRFVSAIIINESE